MRNITLPIIAVALVLVTAFPTARADIIVTAVESGGSVVFSGGGTADLSGLDFDGDVTQGAVILPSFGTLSMGDGPVDVYASITGPTSFGSGDFGLADSFTGDDFAVFGSGGILRVPDG